MFNYSLIKPADLWGLLLVSIVCSTFAGVYYYILLRKIQRMSIMDANKETKLKELDYTIQKCCGNCNSHAIDNQHSDWGVCARHTYIHQKHVGGAKDSNRDLSINRFGCCKDHKFNSIYLLRLEQFQQFVQQ
jgi:hypothetical protein